jgi:hypothetical protein
LELGREWPVGEQIRESEFDCTRFVDRGLDYDDVVDVGHAGLEIEFVLVPAAGFAVEHQVDFGADRFERQEFHAEDDHVSGLRDFEFVWLQVEL